MEEFNLSKKMEELEKKWGWVLAPDYKDVHYRVIDDVREDVKEFIKRLKEKQYVWVTDNTKTGEGHYQISPIGIFIKVEDLDKLAGGKLKWKKK